MIASKLKELSIVAKAIGIRLKEVTLAYPLGPARPVPDRFRGKVEINMDKCIGCAGCANVCPARVIVIKDLDQERRLIEIYRERCTFCGRCQEVCPEDAIKLSPEFELATNNKEDLTDELDIYMASCQRCGRCFKPPTPLDKMMVTGFRR